MMAREQKHTADLLALAERVERAEGPDRRILDRLDRSGDCWLWTGALDPRGRGRVWRGGKITLPDYDEQDRIAASLDAAIARWEAMTGKPFRDPEPTAEEIEQARARADEAMMGPVWCFLACEGRNQLEER